jgi:hypothetical protein
MPDSRGSQRHILDLLDCRNYTTRLQSVVVPHGVVISAADAHRPLGRSAPQEWELPGFCREHCSGWVKSASVDADIWDSMLTGWWLRHSSSPRGKLPTWDLISTCRINDNKGLLLAGKRHHLSREQRASRSMMRSISGWIAGRRDQNDP